MDRHKNSVFSLRIKTEIMDKMKYIAYELSRSTNKEIELACKAYVENYENNYGKITEDELDKFFDKLV